MARAPICEAVRRRVQIRTPDKYQLPFFEHHPEEMSFFERDKIPPLKNFY